MVKKKLEECTHKREESDSLNEELNSLECHLDERLHPPTQVQKWLHVLFIFLKCLFYLCIPKDEKKTK